MVDVARAVFAQSEYRKTQAISDAALKLRDPLSTELEMTSLLDSRSDAETLGSQILELRSEGRSTWVCAVTRGAVSAEVGDTIRVFYPRFGLENGGDFIVKRFRRDLSSLFDTLTLFGPR